MRSLTAVSLIVGSVMAWTITSAQAQVASPQAQQMQGAQRLGDSVSKDAHAGAGASTVKSDDKAYNAALKNLPDKQYDPWRGVR
jgi:hypothetical protein